MFELFAVPEILLGRHGRMLSSVSSGILKTPADSTPGYSSVGLEQAQQIGEVVFRAYSVDTGRDENFPHYAGRSV